MVEHLLYEHSRVKGSWKKVGEILKLNILWHHIASGLIKKIAEQMNKTRNNILSIITCAIFATWVKCGDTKENLKYQVRHFQPALLSLAFLNLT